MNNINYKKDNKILAKNSKNLVLNNNTKNNLIYDEIKNNNNLNSYDETYLNFNKDSIVKYFFCPILSEESEESCSDSHLICELCIEAIKNDILSTLRKKEKENEITVYEIKCILCLKKHLIDYIYFKKTIKKINKCCLIL